MALGVARKKAQDFINNPRKRFVRETEDSYRFRNLPKRDFLDFQFEKITEEIILVLGHLKPTDE